MPVLSAGVGELVVPPDVAAPAGSLLRLRLPGDVLALRYVDRVEDRPDPMGPGRLRHLLLDSPLPSAPTGFDLVTGTLAVTDADPRLPRAETLPRLGLRPDHPRWLGAGAGRGVRRCCGPRPSGPPAPSICPLWTLG